MLSTQPIKNTAQASHYFLRHDNYYTEEQTLAKERSQWWGIGAQSLNLSGPVDAQFFTQLLRGTLPDGQQLGKQDGSKIHHRPGVDLTFSAPKSVSILALMGGDERIFKAIERATDQALSMIERDLAKARVTRLGVIDYIKTGNLVVARFLHDLSREGDPQLHTHCVVMNMTRRTDGQWRSLASQMGQYGEQAKKTPEGFLEAVRHHKKYYGGIFRAELAYEMAQLGYEVVKDQNGFFEIAGISSETIKAYSQRRKDIEAFMQENQLSGAKSAAIATLETRQAKKQINREDLITRWQAKAELFAVPVFEQARETVAKTLQSHAVISTDAMQTMKAPNELEPSTKTQVSEKSIPENFSQKNTESSQNFLPGTDEKSPALTAKQAVLEAMAHLSETRTALSEIDIIHQASQYSLGEPVSITSLLQAVEHLKTTGELIPLPAHDKFQQEAHFTTTKLLQYEKELLESAAKPHPSLQPLVAASPLKAFLDIQTDLTREQHQALFSLFSSEQQVLALEGPTGSGKTHLLKPMMELARLGGYQPLLLTPSKAHSVDLERQLKSVPTNLREWFKSIFVNDSCETVAGFLFRQTNQSPLETKLQEKLQKRPLILIENSTLLSLRQSREVAHHIERLGGRLVVIGDAKSTLTWQSGNPFTLLLEHGVVAAHLTGDQRVVSESLKTAVADTLQGQIQAAFEKIEQRIFAIKNKEERLEVMAAHYIGLLPAERHKTCVLMPTKTACEELNLLIREKLKNKGEIGQHGTMITTLLPHVMTAVEQRYAKSYKVGEWVRFNQDYFSLRVAQGEYRRITSVDPERNVLLLADAAGRVRSWNPAQIAMGKTEVFTEKDRAVAAGDTLVWRRNDKGQGLYNGMRTTVLEVTDRTIKLTLENGKRVTLDRKQPSSVHFDYGHAFTANQRYHTRPDTVIAYQNSTSRQSHQRNFYQMIAQAKQQAWIYTEDQTRLLQNLQQQTGDKATVIGMLLQEANLLSPSASHLNVAHIKLLEAAVQQALSKLQKSSTVTPENIAIEAVRYALAHLGEREAAFTHKEVLDTALRHVLGDVSTKQIEQAVKQAEETGQLIRGICSRDGTSWTTQAALKQEWDIIALAKKDQGQLPQLLNTDNVAAYQQAHPLSQEQSETLSSLALVTDRVVLIQGFAGTRKTTLLQHVQTLMQSQNHHLLCLAPTHAAVKELRARGLEGQTMDHFLAQQSMGKRPANSEPLLIAVDESSMVSNRRKHEFLEAVHQLSARGLIMGDTRQYASIESGKPFELLQKAGIQTLFLKDITRQQDETLKVAVKTVYQGEWAKTFNILENNIVEIGSQKVDNKIIDNRDQRLEAIRDDYLARDLTRRAQTLIVTFGNEDRILQNAIIREGLKAEGELYGDSLESRVLVARNMTEIERTRASNYQSGDNVRFNLSDRRFGIEKDQYWTVAEVLAKQNTLVLAREEAKIIWKPRPLTDDIKTVGVEVYRTEKRELQAGDLIRWTRTDKQLGLLSPELAKVEAVHEKQVTVRAVTIGEKGMVVGDTPIPITPGEARFQHWDHAYAVTGYSAQGKTISEVIINAESFRPYLTSQPSFLVSITRAVQKLTLYTDNKQALLEAISQNAGEKSSALQTVGAFPYSNRQLSELLPSFSPPSTGIVTQSIEDSAPTNAHPSLSTPTIKTVNRGSNHASFPPYSAHLSSTNNPKPPLLDSQRIYQSLLANAEQVVERLLGEPKAKEAGNYRYGSHQGSLIITLNGDKCGLWHDFQTGEGGNLFQLIANQNNLDMKWDFKQVLEKSLQLVGTSEEDLTVRKPLRSTSSTPQNKSTTLTPQQQKSLRYARQLARESQPLAGTLAEHYLREHRGIPLDKFPASLRFHLGIYSKRNEAIHPALLVIAKDEQQKVQAVQAIFLDEKTAQKANVPVKKQTWGIPSQCAVKLVKDPVLARQHKPTYLAEGAETALSIYAAMGGGDVRITLGKSNFKNIDSKTTGKHIVLCLDNDGNRLEGDKLIQFAAENLLKQNKQVWVAKPQEVGQDYNDVLKKQGLPAVKKAMNNAMLYLDYSRQKAPITTLKSAIKDQQNALRNDLKLEDINRGKVIQNEDLQAFIQQGLTKNLDERPLTAHQKIVPSANKNLKAASVTPANHQASTQLYSVENSVQLPKHQGEKIQEPEI